MMLSTDSSKRGVGAAVSGAVAATSASAARPETRRADMRMEKYTIALNRSFLPNVY